MSGIYKGVQAKIKESCQYAEYIPCSAHSLNLVGTCAAQSCQESVKFFNIFQELHNLTTLSTQRSQILKDECESYKKQKEKEFLNSSDQSKKVTTRKTVKDLSDTRWSARHDSCESLLLLWEPIIKALEKIEGDKTQKPINRCQATGILKELNRLETAFMTCFWEFLLHRINAVSKQLQLVDIEIFSVIKLYEGLINLVAEIRNENSFDKFEKQALNLSKIKIYEKVIKRQVNKAKSDKSSSEEIDSNFRNDFRINVYYVILDNLSAELQTRCEAYKKFGEKFGFLIQLKNLNNDDIQLKAEFLANFYPEDLECDNLIKECLHFKSQCTSITDQYDFHQITEGYSGQNNIKTKKMKITAIYLLNWIIENDCSLVYPNILIALRICVTAAISNCSGERSFCTLKRVENYLRTTINQVRLNALALLNIEHEMMELIDTDILINNFADSKCRRKKL